MECAGLICRSRSWKSLQVCGALAAVLGSSSGVGNVWLKRLCWGSMVALRIVLGAVLLWAGVSKLCQPYGFLGSVFDFALVPTKVGIVLAIAIPSIELATGLCLLGGVLLPGAFAAASGMFVLFVLAQIAVLYRGGDVPCGCFGASNGSVSYSTVIRTCVLLLCAIGGYAWHLKYGYGRASAIATDEGTQGCRSGRKRVP